MLPITSYREFGNYVHAKNQPNPDNGTMYSIVDYVEAEVILQTNKKEDLSPEQRAIFEENDKFVDVP